MLGRIKVFVCQLSWAWHCSSQETEGNPRCVNRSEVRWGEVRVGEVVNIIVHRVKDHKQTVTGITWWSLTMHDTECWSGESRPQFLSGLAWGGRTGGTDLVTMTPGHSPLSPSSSSSSIWQFGSRERETVPAPGQAPGHHLVHSIVGKTHCHNNSDQVKVRHYLLGE